ncbi:hypothetical protein A0H81_08914 [Grifola frondosa]|uniref:Uncharacterized protein n=1 Tax=Grifola frondosa TaxID=5627 RepID=A0A1C7M3X7_GRIFR|nr:hypothetical protein A0H81_08914 [Grifola frondosa]
MFPVETLVVPLSAAERFKLARLPSGARFVGATAHLVGPDGAHVRVHAVYNGTLFLARDDDGQTQAQNMVGLYFINWGVRGPWRVGRTFSRTATQQLLSPPQLDPVIGSRMWCDGLHTKLNPHHMLGQTW